MKLTLILLIALACYCSTVYSELCPSVENSVTAFLSGTADDLKEELKKHVPRSKYGITNAQKVQSCTQDEFTEKEKEGLYDLVKKMVDKCSSDE
ncbi:major allergen I polypeptide chain 1-like [Podarcis raffonei]|uniref:major allergen I polypeptide chain 1-like n=1 Tax=Podarcis raffonei TaxID=65483 RepID=UPI0023298945|nr:major allergen I polypeptide chain 1-like [Podarcis raffonei]